MSVTHIKSDYIINNAIGIFLDTLIDTRKDMHASAC